MSALFARHAVLSWLEISFDRTLDEADVQRLVLGIISGRNLGSVVFETVWTKGQVHYRLGSAIPTQLQAIIETCLPSVTVFETERKIEAHGQAWTVRSSTRRRSLEIGDPEGVTQRFLGALQTEGAVYQVVVGRRLHPNAVPSQLEGLRSERWTSGLIEAALVGNQRIDSEARRAVASKQAEPGAEVNLRLLVPGERARPTSPASFASAIRSLEAPRLRLWMAPERWTRARIASPSGKRLPLNASELSAVLAWPFGERGYRGLDRSGSRMLPASKAVVSDASERFIGRGLHPATQIEVGLSVEDGLRHLWTLGPTGVGKSTLLEHLALQDIEAGRGVVVIDPKGDLVDGLLARVDAEHLDRLVVLDPARTDQVVGFNPLAVKSDEVELAVDGVLHVLHSLNRDSWGPRTQDILHASLLTLAHSEQPTLAAIPRLLSDERFRRSCMRSGLPPALRAFWSWCEQLSSAERASVTAPVLNKIRPFTLRSPLRTMLGQYGELGPRFDLAEVFTERKVLLVPLRKGQIGSESANLVGSLLMARLWQLVQARSGLPATRRRPVFAYLDEFQDYLRLPTDFTDVLAQSRGLGLGLVLAHQHLAQLTPDVRAAISANAQSKILFRLGSEDANVFGRRSSELEAVDFQELRAYQAYASLLNRGQRTGWMSVRTLPPRRALRASGLIASTLSHHWGVAPSAVDVALYGSPGSDEPDAPIGERKRDGS